MPYPHPEPLSPRQTTADPYLHRRPSNTVLSVSVGSLGPGVRKVCLQLAPRLGLTGATRNVPSFIVYG